MKKIWMQYFAIILAALILAGCNNTNKISSSGSTSSKSAKASSAVANASSESVDDEGTESESPWEGGDSDGTESTGGGTGGGSSRASSSVSSTVTTTPIANKPIIKPTKPDSGAFAPGKTLTGKNNKLQNIRLVTTSVKSYEKIEIETDIPSVTSDLNVFDEADFDLSIQLTSSTGVKINMPGFYYEEYTFRASGQQEGRSTQAPDYRLRFTFTEEGTWDFVITLKIKGTVTDTASGYINSVRGSDLRGFLGVEPVRKQVFAFENGTTYSAIGQNIAWSNLTASMRSAEMIGFMKDSAEYGSNYTRFWLTTWWLSLQKTSNAPNDFSGGMADAAQIDKIFEAVSKIDMYVCFTLFTHNMFGVSKIPAGESSWSGCPYNAATAGGYLNNPGDFYKDARAIKDTKTYLRYLVARYGYTQNIMAWEFFNETDLTDGDSEDIREWHLTMSDYLREIDPYNHMITTSTANKDNTLNQNSMFDFLSLHWYNYGSLSNLSTEQKTLWQIYQRPVMFGEIGLNRNVSASIDADLINFHQQNWIGVMGGGGGSASNWFWTELDKVNGYWDFQVVSEMAARIPWSDSGMFMVGTTNVSPSNSQVDVQGYRGAEYAYLWLYDNKFSHISKTETAFDSVTLTIKLKDGKYHVRWINTWTGVSEGKTVLTAVDDELKITTPKWRKDIAVAITRD